MSVPSSYPDPHSHPASWCAVWTRLGGTWRMREGKVELVGGMELVEEDTLQLAAMLVEVDPDGRQVIANHLGAAIERRGAWPG